MFLEQQKVVHSKYGKGTVIKHEDSIVTVKFSEKYGIRRFDYPNAFERFLTVSDDELNKAVLVELSQKQTELEEEKRQKELIYAEEIQSRSTKKAPAKTTTKKKKISE